MTLEALAQKLAEEYGKKVREEQVKRRPPHFVTGEFPTFDGRPDFTTMCAFESGATNPRIHALVRAQAFTEAAELIGVGPRMFETHFSYVKAQLLGKALENLKKAEEV